MIETDHQNFFAIGVSWLVPDLVKSLKMELGPKVFPGQQKIWNSYLQNFIHFLFAKFQLVLSGRFGDIVVYEFNEYLLNVCDVARIACFVSVMFDLI